MDGSTNKDCLMDLDNSNVLIDLKSPADKNRYKLPSPLIPCPQIKEPLIYSNPFDIVATEANYCDTNDPFEMVFNSAFCTSKITFNKHNDNESTKMNSDIKIDVQKKPDEICESRTTFNNIDVNNKNPSTIKKNLDDKLSAKKVDCNEYSNLKITDTSSSPSSEFKKTCIHQLNMESTKSSLSSLDLSSEETIRASIARRIKKCAQKVLNNSPYIDYRTTFNKDSQTGKLDQSTRRSLPPQLPQLNISDTCNTENKKLIPLKLMFSPIISKPVKNISEISPVLNNNKIIHNNSTRWSTGSSELNKALLFSASSGKCSANSETPLSDCPDAELSVIEVEDSVFIEAKKLADTFSEIASNFSQMNLSDEAEDLMSCNPKWEPVDSSDEETDMLRNDPALNLKFSSGNLQPLPSPKKCVEFSDAVIQYKKRRSFELNSSLNQNSSDQPDVAQLKRSHSFHGSESPNHKKTQGITSNNDPLIVSDHLIKKQPGVVPVTQEVLSQKLKAKKPVAEVKKKGPLKAIIPLQNMTRGVLKGFKKKDSPKQSNVKVVQNGAPVRKKKGNHKRYSSPVPVASSTPNKHTPFNESSPVSSPVLQIKKNMSHHSLNSSEELQKNTLQDLKRRSTSLSNFSSDKENININRTKSSSSVSDLKKVSLSLGGGLVIFASVLSDAYMDRPRRPLTAPGSSQLLFDYRYGWSFFAAGAAFIMAEFAALVSITAYLRRFPTVEDMVRVMVPGADRRLRAHHQQNEFLVRRQGGYTNKQEPQNKNKGETLIPSDLEGVDGPLLTSKTPPDICTTPGTNVPTGVELNCEEDILNINYRRSSGQHHHHNHLAGTTVPIKLMHQQCTGGGVTVGGIVGSKLASNYHNPHHHVHHQEYHQRYATIGSCTLVHQGMLGVSEGVPGTSSSSGSSASSGGMVTSTGSSISSKSFQHVPRQRKAITTTASSTTSSIINKPNAVFTPLETLEHKSPTSVSSSQGYCSGSTV